MAIRRLAGWNLLFLGIMLIGFAAAIYHAANDRWGNALIAAGAAILGTIVALLVEQPAPAPVEQRSQLEPVRDGRSTLRRTLADAPSDVPHDRWLSGSILAGFAATIVMSLMLVFAYLLTGIVGDENGNQLAQWFWGLSHNDLTDGIWDIPIAALLINFLAGIAWALIYGLVVEPRLSGPGWWRGLLFSLGPWILSLVVFFPAVGAGFLGSNLEAGPLPVLGNLVLHLIYGVTLGAVYALPEVSEVPGDQDSRVARSENDGMAFGLVIGLAGGIVLGALISAVATLDGNDALNLTLAAGAIGVAIGGLVGSFAGIDIGTRHEAG
jgi:hypothetical protein